MSYEEALRAAGCEVIEFEEFGSYQGEWLALVEIDGERGVVEGCYGSCSGCDSFQAEFGWNDDERDDYQERLADFGRGYLPALPFEHYIKQFEEKCASEWADSEDQEMLDTVKRWAAL